MEKQTTIYVARSFNCSSAKNEQEPTDLQRLLE